MGVGNFPGVSDPGTRQEITRYAQQLETRLPLARFQFVDATFGTANQDLDITHALRPQDAESVRWSVVKQSAALSVYQDLSATRKAWQTDHIFLRASAAGSVRLLLFVEPL